MKKRILVGALIFSLMSSIFAVETKYDSFGLHFSVPLVFETATESGAKAESNMTSIGFGIHALSLYTDRIGLYVNLDLVFPQTMNMKVTYGGVTQSYSVSRSDYDSLWVMAALFAPAISIIHTDKMLFTVSPGIHYTMMFADAAYATASYVFGIGANIQDSIFFSSNGYFTIGADIAYDFLGFTIANGESKSGGTHDFIFNPKIGVGFRFK